MARKKIEREKRNTNKNKHMHTNDMNMGKDKTDKMSKSARKVKDDYSETPQQKERMTLANMESSATNTASHTWG